MPIGIFSKFIMVPVRCHAATQLQPNISIVTKITIFTGFVIHGPENTVMPVCCAIQCFVDLLYNLRIQFIYEHGGTAWYLSRLADRNSIDRVILHGSAFMMTLTTLALFCLFVALRVPVAMAMILAATAVLIGLSSLPLLVIPQYMIAGLTKFELLAIPFFILAAEIMNAGGVTRRIFDFALACVGWMRGGLAQVNVVASIVFAGISGTAVADAAGLGRVEVRAMRLAGYDLGLSSAVTLASCIIGPLVPPSVVLIVYAIIAEASVGRMLLAGVGPGLCVAVFLMAYIYLKARQNPEMFPVSPRLPMGEIFQALVNGFPAIIAPFIILLGIVGGVFTPTEAGVVACVYSLAISVLIYREIRLSDIGLILRRTIFSTASVMFIISAATLMSWIVTYEQSAAHAAVWLSAISDNIYMKLLLINIGLLLIGCLIEGVPALLILTPIMLPIAADLGLDPLHLGTIMILNIVIGAITPPMGVGLFIMSKITGLPTETVMRSTLPFLIPLLMALLAVTYFPALSLWLPERLMG
jgi:tripartite ATP-independent transporter DctM subunit